MGDELLRAVAQRVFTLMRRGDTLSRFSGDEFVFLCEELGSVDDVTKLVMRIDETFLEPFCLEGGVEIKVHASVGSAYVGPGEAITSELLSSADLDMYRAKRQTIGANGLEGELERFNSGDQSLERDVRRAMETGQLEIAYQPIMRSADGGVAGVEALLRWTHPHRGPIPPLMMVSLAERSDLIGGIGGWALERACQDHATWSSDGSIRPLDLAVNVSVRQLMMPEFCSTVSTVIEHTGMDPRSLVLELTESIAMEHSSRIGQALLVLGGFGVRLALDDFGTGYSALGYLSRLPIDILKIDRSLIVDLDQPAGRIVVRAVSNMAHELGLEVVAEGVETELQYTESISAGVTTPRGSSTLAR